MPLYEDLPHDLKEVDVIIAGGESHPVQRAILYSCHAEADQVIHQVVHLDPSSPLDSVMPIHRFPSSFLKVALTLAMIPQPSTRCCFSRTWIPVASL
jgi:hypothetical protein